MGKIVVQPQMLEQLPETVAQKVGSYPNVGSYS
jgi:hypothetical protein